ncbi:MAG: protein arginine kinase [Phycisphaerae bacterium]
MKLAELTQHAGEWLCGRGPMHDVVISSRARLARNLAGMPFLTRCTEEQTAELEQRLRDEILRSRIGDDMFYVDVASASDLDRRILVERHLISRHQADTAHPRGVAISGDERIAVMVNEEDHLRIQSLRSGLQLEKALEECMRIDDLLGKRIDYSYHSRYGYLTACPTNVGTGLRVSVMLHLPALKMTGEIEKAFRAARDMQLAIRGLYGEGTEASGDFFQISNQITLGKTEEQIVDEFLCQTILDFIEYERKARQSLVERKGTALDDKIFRAEGILKSCRQISSEETLYLLSLVRLGINLGRIDSINMKQVNELFLSTQTGHLQKILDRSMSGGQRDQARSEFVREKLCAN